MTIFFISVPLSFFYLCAGRSLFFKLIIGFGKSTTAHHGRDVRGEFAPLRASP
jgi:hypothetical protein